MMILIERSDSGVSILCARDDADAAAEVEKWASSASTNELPVIRWRKIDVTDLPNSRTFRDAWNAAGGAISIDMAKARSIHMGRIREARDAKLKTLDIPALRAVESGDSAAVTKIAAQKQALRDIPQILDLTKADTPEALAAIWPEDLTA